MTFSALKKLEPRLGRIEKAVQAFDCKSCTISFWYRNAKPELLQIVGWALDDTQNPLASSEAYDCAYQHLYNLLPACTASSCDKCPQRS